MKYYIPTADDARRISALKQEEIDQKNDATHRVALAEAMNRGQRSANLTLPISTTLYDQLIRTGYKIGKPFDSDYGGEQSVTVSW